MTFPKACAVALILVLLMPLNTFATQYQYSRSLSPGYEDDIEFNTSTGQPAASPSNFMIPTSYGDIEGSAYFFQGTANFTFFLGDDQISLVLGPYDSVYDILSVSIGFSGIGTLEYYVGNYTGEVSLVSSDVQDCSLIATNPLYNAIIEAVRSFQEAFSTLNPDDVSTTDNSVGTIYLMLSFVANAPSLVQDCVVIQDPLYGVCVIHSKFEDCLGCCDNSDAWVNVAALGCGVVSLFLANPQIGAICLASFLGESQCRTTICEGKPGDPSLTTCTGTNGNVGTCKFACDGMPGDEYIGACQSDDTLMCCGQKS